MKTIGTHMIVLSPSESNFKVDLTSYYRESTTLQVPMYIIMRHIVLIPLSEMSWS